MTTLGIGKPWLQHWHVLTLLLTITLLLPIASRATETPSPVPVKFAPQWIPQAQFAGYYVAKEKGFYADQGLDVTILQGGPALNVTNALENGAVDFGSLWLSTGLQLRSKGTRLVNIAQVVQRSALMLVAKSSSGISTPEDMRGKKVGLWGGDFQLQPSTFFAKYNVDVEIIPQNATMNLFLRDGVDVASAMWYNGYHRLLNSGLDEEDLNTFFFHEYGLNFPEDGIYCHQETLDKNPDIARRFVAASAKGWQYARVHRDEALEIVMKQVRRTNQATNKAHQRWMLDRMIELIFTGDQGNEFGHLLEEDFNRVYQTLLDHGAIDTSTSLDYRTFYVGETP